MSSARGDLNADPSSSQGQQEQHVAADGTTSENPPPQYSLSGDGSTEDFSTNADVTVNHKRQSQCLASDSGTDADDEGPPSSRSYTVLTVLNDCADVGDATESASSPFAFRPEGFSRLRRRSRGLRKDEGDIEPTGLAQEKSRRDHLQILRRVSESALMITIGAIVSLGVGVSSALVQWHLELKTFLIIIALLYSTYPIRKYTFSFIRLRYKILITFPFSPQFDPAPLIYPVFLPLLISSSLSTSSSSLILPNMVLGLSSLPPQVVPLFADALGYSPLHWMLSILPFLPAEHYAFYKSTQLPLSLRDQEPELLVLLYPFHQALSSVLYFLTTSSLLPSELQLLTTGLINLLLHTRTPHAEILKAILWVGGLCVLITCKDLCHMQVMLSRIPTWKFKRPSYCGGVFRSWDQRLCSWLCRSGSRADSSSDSDGIELSLLLNDRIGSRRNASPQSLITQTDKSECVSSACDGDDFRFVTDAQPDASADLGGMLNPLFSPISSLRQRRRSSLSPVRMRLRHRSQSPIRRTSSGRRRRVFPASLRPYLQMTADQAQTRKWAYAALVYLFIVGITLGPVRTYISENALGGSEPIGWLIAYMFGNISFIRFWLVLSNLDTWIPLPPRTDNCLACDSAWIEHLRQDVFGAANTRLLICAYYVSVLIIGLLVVIRLSKTVETDTRRKVFHVMMVAMLTPTTFVDPTFVSIALAAVLSIFLVLEVIRAAQLPPIAKPLTLFVAPYVDGRDYRGPVVISHIFLLIGCAIPLWLSLASVVFEDSTAWKGWDAQTRDISMISGIICVGMGDAAASLIGRRFGRRRWYFGGGKSIEGSIAFAVAVFIGLVTARIWIL
ncbi:hypothetical protein KEM54_001927, partial [Ascosphaera aggregata]